MTKTKGMKSSEQAMKTYLFTPQYSGLTQKIFIGILLTPIVIGIFMLMTMYLKKKNTKYRLSPDRLTMQTGIFAKNMSNLELWRVSDVQFKQTAMQVMFGDCTIELITKDISHPVLHIDGLSVKRAKIVYDILNRYVAHALKKGGVMQTI
jgi:uncharacterized membrane protein YdbT with pleckstrin-like domain